MKKQQIFSVILLVLLSGLFVSAQSTDKTVESINKRYAEVAAKATACETDDDQGEYGELFMNTLTINSRSHQWRAVGIYGHTYKFFYRAVENDERRLYPDQLVFVRVERKVSNRNYAEEYLYSEKGELMFYAQKAENDDHAPAEKRIYFLRMQTLRTITDGKIQDRFPAAENKNLAEIQRVAARIKEIFDRSLRL